MTTSSLPDWLQYVQAVAVPLIGAVIAATGVWIAMQQMRIARTKLKHDLYDRRFAIYLAAKKLLEETIFHDDASEEGLRSFLLGTADSPFLFNNEIVRYLRDIGEHASLVYVARSTMKAFLDDDKRQELSATASKNLAWLSAQPDALVEEFKPFLKLERSFRRA